MSLDTRNNFSVCDFLMNSFGVCQDAILEEANLTKIIEAIRVVFRHDSNGSLLSFQCIMRENELGYEFVLVGWDIGFLDAWKVGINTLKKDGKSTVADGAYDEAYDLIQKGNNLSLRSYDLELLHSGSNVDDGELAEVQNIDHFINEIERVFVLQERLISEFTNNSHADKTIQGNILHCLSLNAR